MESKKIIGNKETAKYFDKQLKDKKDRAEAVRERFKNNTLGNTDSIK